MSGSWACAVFQDLRWFPLQWNPYLCTCYLSTAVEEFILVVLAVALFGRYWASQVVQFVVDNKAVVDVFKPGASWPQTSVHLVF